jgi:hypothetical protein
MTLADSFHQLTPDRQRRVHLRLCEHALETWRRHAVTHGPIRYADSVAGMRHEVDLELPADAFRSALRGADLARVARRYLEPIAAMQDEDLTFPDPVRFAYYAIYNCFEKYVAGREIDGWVIVNQALSSQEDSSEWAQLLSEAVAAVSKSPPNET